MLINQFAVINSNNIVNNIIVAENENIIIENNIINSNEFTIQLKESDRVSIGFSYNKENNVFISPKPYNSWVLNTTTYDWEAPIADPSTETTFYSWNEETQTWDLMA